MTSTSTDGLFARRPLLSSIAIVLVFTVVWAGLPPLVGSAVPISLTVGLLAAVVLIVTLFILTRRGWAAAAGFTAPWRWRAPWLLLPLVIAAGINSAPSPGMHGARRRLEHWSRPLWSRSASRSRRSPCFAA